MLSISWILKGSLKIITKSSVAINPHASTASIHPLSYLSALSSYCSSGWPQILILLPLSWNSIHSFRMIQQLLSGVRTQISWKIYFLPQGVETVYTFKISNSESFGDCLHRKQSKALYIGSQWGYGMSRQWDITQCPKELNCQAMQRHSGNLIS